MKENKIFLEGLRMIALKAHFYSHNKHPLIALKEEARISVLASEVQAGILFLIRVNLRTV